MNPLAEIIREEISKQGVIPFARFMELALYAPGSGYYEKGRAIGRKGDFFTNISVGNLFGEMLGFKFGRWLEEIGGGGGIFLEAGAHDGQLALDILSWLQEWRPRQFEQIEYWIVEPSSSRRDWQREKLDPFSSKIRWVKSWGEIAEQEIQGIMFSNEILDAIPVHRIGWDRMKRSWFEWGVVLEGEGFGWSKIAKNRAEEQFGFNDWPQVPVVLEEHLPDGFCIERSPAGAEWWKEAARRLGRGKLLTIDYGLEEEDFFLPQRAEGTLRAYYRHQIHSDVFARPGEQDITAHVNFSVIRAVGEGEGLKTEELIPQRLFLTRIAEEIWRDGANFGEWKSQQVRQFQTLVHPEHLGRSFKVLVQEKGMGF